MFAKKVFISHSSTNKEIADHLCAFISRLGVKQDRIFCSSVIGQGVDNGEKLNDKIADAIGKSSLLIFLISHDFLASSYCMEELGVGWYLAHNKSVTCFYLILPDIDTSELKGFVNSKIDRFTFLDLDHRSDLSQLAEDICKKLRVKPPKHPTVTNIEDNFLSGIKVLVSTLLENIEKPISEKVEMERRVQQLEDELSEKTEIINRLRMSLKAAEDERKKSDLLIEKRALERTCLLLGFSKGISKEQYKMFRKDFWFYLVNRYNELQNELNSDPTDDCMELLLSTIYIANNDSEKAYQHLLNFIQLCDYPISMYTISNFLPYYKGSVREVIDILQSRATHTAEGSMRDSYLETIKALEEREVSHSKARVKKPSKVSQ
jgi:hypothetical protein